MPQTELPNNEAAILTRMVGPDEPNFSPAAAEAILGLRFSQVDQDRMNTLAAKAQAGTLTPQEQAEVEAYSRIGSLVAILKSKARRSLKRRRSTNALRFLFPLGPGIIAGKEKRL